VAARLQWRAPAQQLELSDAGGDRALVGSSANKPPLRRRHRRNGRMLGASRQPVGRASPDLDAPPLRPKRAALRASQASAPAARTMPADWSRGQLKVVYFSPPRWSGITPPLPCRNSPPARLPSAIPPSPRSPPDHLIIELDFAGYLKMRQALALARGDPGAASVAASSSFRNDHLTVMAEPIARLPSPSRPTIAPKQAPSCFIA